MYQETVPVSTIIGMCFALFISIALPIALMIIWKAKAKAKIAPFFIGAGFFIVFVLLLESLVNSLVYCTSFGDLLDEKAGLYALYAGLMAGIFEECARYLAMKFFMKKSLSKENAVMYGIGHGGIEAIVLVGLTMINNLLYTMIINSGKLETLLSPLDSDTQIATYVQLSKLWLTNADVFYLTGIERISTILIHISLSYIVYLAVKNREAITLVIAIFVHAFIDTLTVVLGKRGATEWVIEGVLLVLALALLIYTIRLYKSEKIEPEKNNAEEVKKESEETIKEKNSEANDISFKEDETGAKEKEAEEIKKNEE